MFSVIIATYNAGKTVETAVQSVLDQEGVDCELIIVDGKSTDDTMEKLSRFKNKIAYLESSPDKGIYDAWNKALPHVKNEWVYFLGADDYFIDKTALSQIAKHLKKETGKSLVCYGSVLSVTENDVPLCKYNTQEWKHIKTKFFQINGLHHQGVFHHKSFFAKFGMFDPTFKIAGDFEMLLRYLNHADPVFINTLVAAARVGGLSTTLSNSRRCLLEFRKAIKKHTGKEPGLLWFYCFAKVLFKEVLQKTLGNKATSFMIQRYRNSKYKKLSQTN